jgi:hypothetical protein
MPIRKLLYIITVLSLVADCTDGDHMRRELTRLEAR